MRVPSRTTITDASAACIDPQIQAVRCSRSDAGSQVLAYAPRRPPLLRVAASLERAKEAQARARLKGATEKGVRGIQGCPSADGGAGRSWNIPARHAG